MRDGEENTTPNNKDRSPRIVLAASSPAFPAGGRRGKTPLLVTAPGLRPASQLTPAGAVGEGLQQAGEGEERGCPDER